MGCLWQTPPEAHHKEVRNTMKTTDTNVPFHIRKGGKERTGGKERQNKKEMESKRNQG